MATPVNTLMEEAKCYLCLGISIADAMTLALLNRISEGSSGAGYLSYVALLTQSGTNAPVATVLENTLGGAPVWSRDNVGQYRVTLANAFPTASTYYNILATDDPGSSPNVAGVIITSSSVIRVFTADVVSNSYGDDLLSSRPFEIRVYP